MKHERPDYARIQDPAANEELLAAFDAALGLVANLLPKRDDLTEREAALLKALNQLTRHLHPTCGYLVGLGAEPPDHPIAAEEPVFLLRARDQLAPYILREYARHLRQNGGGWDAPKRIVAQAKAMEAWATAHGAKMPDAPVATQQEQEHA